MSFFNHRNNLIHAAIAAALSTINIYIVLSLEPPNLAQGIFGNIFYIHVPVAWTAFLLYLCVMISGILFLTKKDQVWDRRGLAFAEVGTIFMFLEDGVKAGEFPNINPQLLFKAMGGLFMGLVLMGDRKKQVSEKDIEELLNQLIMNPQEQL